MEKKENFDFDKLVNVINYYDVQKDFLVLSEDELEEFDFDTLYEKGMDEDDFPDSFGEFEELGIDIDEIVVWGTDNGRPPVSYFLDKDGDMISILTDEFTMKEAITVIGLVMEHQRLNIGWCHNVSIRRNTDENVTVYAQESTAFGLWWNDFMKLYGDNMEHIGSIEIELGNTSDRSIDITLNMKAK